MYNRTPSYYYIDHNQQYGHQHPLDMHALPRVNFNYQQPKVNFAPSINVFQYLQQQMLPQPQPQPQIQQQPIHQLFQQAQPHINQLLLNQFNLQLQPQAQQPQQHQQAQPQAQTVQYSTIIHSNPNSKPTKDVLLPKSPTNPMTIQAQQNHRFPTTGSTMFKEEKNQGQIQYSKVYRNPYNTTQITPQIRRNQINMNELPILESVFKSGYDNGNNLLSQHKMLQSQRNQLPLIKHTIIHNLDAKIPQQTTQDKQSMLHSSVMSKRPIAERLNIHDQKIRNLQIRVQQLQSKQGIPVQGRAQSLDILQMIIGQYERLLAIIDLDRREPNPQQESIRQKLKQLYSKLKTA